MYGLLILLTFGLLILALGDDSGASTGETETWATAREDACM